MFEEEHRHRLGPFCCKSSGVVGGKNDEKKEEDRKEELEKERGEKREGWGRRQTKTDGKKDKCGKTRWKRELKGEGEEMER